jgi:hypothetical protein
MYVCTFLVKTLLRRKKSVHDLPLRNFVRFPPLPTWRSAKTTLRATDYRSYMPHGGRASTQHVKQSISSIPINDVGSSLLEWQPSLPDTWQRCSDQVPPGLEPNVRHLQFAQERCTRRNLRVHVPFLSAVSFRHLRSKNRSHGSDHGNARRRKVIRPKTFKNHDFSAPAMTTDISAPVHQEVLRQLRALRLLRSQYLGDEKVDDLSDVDSVGVPDLRVGGLECGESDAERASD